MTRYDQYRTLTGLRQVRPETLEFGLTVCRGTLARLDLAFAAFFRRVRAGQTPGFPRFKGAVRFDSVSWPDPRGWKVHETRRRLYLQGLGEVKFHANRPLRGTPRTITVRREASRWFLTVFCTEVPAQLLPATGKVTGIDLGVTHLATLSDGTTIPHPRPAKHAARRLAAAQRDLARRERGSIRRREAAQRIAAIHRKVARSRLDHLHKASRTLVDGFDLIVHENLKITNMTRRPAPRPDGQGGYEPNRAAQKSGLNRSILDAGWGTLLRMVAYKAEDAGRAVIAVDPRHTSQRCGQCGHTAKDNRVAQAVFRCQGCGHQADADANAAGNILRAGLAQRQAQADREVRDVA